MSRPAAFGFLALLWLQLLSMVSASATQDSGCNLFFCLNITVVNNDFMDFEVTPVFEPFGWVGLGWGRQMKDTHMVVMYEDEHGGPILSQRFGVGHVEPVPDAEPPRRARLMESKLQGWRPTKGTGNYSTKSFTIPFNKTDPYPGTMIWAYSLRKPDPSIFADLTGHYVAGTINMRITPGAKTGPESHVTESPDHDALPRYQKIIWHGILLSFGFLVLLPAGGLMARWFRTLTPRWFKVHRALNFYIALPVIVCGWLLGPLAVLDRQAAHLADAHQICGVLLFGVYIGQLFLGRYIHSRHSVPGRVPHPPSNILHVVLGITTVGLAFLQVRSGFGEWEMQTGQPDVSHWCHELLTAWALILPVLYFTGLLMLRRQFAQEQQKGATYEGDGTEGKNYIALAETPTFDIEDMDVPAYREYNNELEVGVPLLRAPQRSAA